MYPKRALNLRLALCEQQALDAVAHYEGRTPTAMLRELIRQAARERGLWGWICRQRQLEAIPGDVAHDDGGPELADVGSNWNVELGLDDTAYHPPQAPDKGPS